MRGFVDLGLSLMVLYKWKNFLMIQILIPPGFRDSEIEAYGES